MFCSPHRDRTKEPSLNQKLFYTYITECFSENRKTAKSIEMQSYKRRIENQWWSDRRMSFMWSVRTLNKQIVALLPQSIIQFYKSCISKIILQKVHTYFASRKLLKRSEYKARNPYYKKIQSNRNTFEFFSNSQLLNILDRWDAHKFYLLIMLPKPFIKRWTNRPGQFQVKCFLCGRERILI